MTSMNVLFGPCSCAGWTNEDNPTLAKAVANLMQEGLEVNPEQDGQPTAMTKEDDMIAKIRENNPALSGEDEAKIRASFREIESDPNICPDCWSGGAYLDGRRICDCWSKEDIARLEAGVLAGSIERREDGDVTHFTTKRM